MSSDHRDESSTSIIKLRPIVGSIKTWGEQTRFYFWRYSVVVCHKLSHFNSQLFILGFTWNCCRLQEAKKFSRNPGQFWCVTRETRYYISIAELLKRFNNTFGQYFSVTLPNVFASSPVLRVTSHVSQKPAKNITF